MRYLLSTLILLTIAVNAFAQSQPIYRVCSLGTRDLAPPRTTAHCPSYTFSFTGDRTVPPFTAEVLDPIFDINAFFDGDNPSYVLEPDPAFKYDEVETAFKGYGGSSSKSKQYFDAAGRVIQWDKWHFQYAGNTIQRITKKDPNTGAILADRIYNAAGQPDTFINFEGTPRVDYYVYDAVSGKLIEHHTNQPYTIGKYYHYDQNNLLTEKYELNNASGTYDTATITYYHYTAQNLQDSILVVKAGQNGFSNSVLSVNSYQNGVRTERSTFQWVNAVNNWDTVVIIHYRYNVWGLLSQAYESYYLGVAAFFSRYIEIEYEMIWPTGISEINDGKNKLKIYPSPATDAITLQADLETTQPVIATIYDLQGKAVKKWEEPPAKQIQKTVQISDLPAGVYILNLRNEEQIFNRRFVKK